jgi:uncharacterized membrane protein YcaP (DUF421 family)
VDSVIRAAAIYVGLLVIFRLTGKRTIEQITTFDFILLLIISEATQQALLGEDFSLTTAFIVILTFVGLELAISLLGANIPWVAKLVDGTPLVVVEHGKPIEKRLSKSRLTKWDILEQARSTQGLERMDQIKYAVLEKSGAISIIPYRDGEAASA